MGTLSHLDELEAEAIYIMREVAAECEKPVMLYSIGKDSSVMLHLAVKAFYPEKPPFPFMHIDTTWKFKEMIEFRDKIAKEKNLTTVMVTHNLRYAVEYGNRLIMMHEGKVILNISGEEKKKLTVEDLLHQFEKVSGEEFANDKALLS